MRAADRPHTSTAMRTGPRTESLLPLCAAVVATLALLLVWRPSVLRAQDSVATRPIPEATTQMHVVKRGDTLWSLAARYYGDGHQWPLLARRNGIAANAETLLQVGLQLAVPARQAAGDTQAATQAAMDERSVIRTGLLEQNDRLEARTPAEVLTVFHRDLPDAAEAERRTRAALRPNTPAPRQAEFDAAPWITPATALAQAGRIIARVGSPTSNGDAYPQRAIRTDQVIVQPVQKHRYTVGDLLVSVTSPTGLGKGQQVVVPSGVLEVVQADAGKPVLAVVIRQSGRIEQGQKLLPWAGEAGVWVKTQKLETPDVSTTVRWLDSHEFLPTLQSFVLLAAGSAQGLKAGDEMALYNRATKERPERIAATVRLVRVERDHAAAIVTQQYDTEIAVGMTARRYAMAP